MILREAPREHYEWIAKRAVLKIGDDFRAMEAVDGDRILGMVGFDGWHPNSCLMHVALDVPLAGRHLLRPAFEFVFIRAGLGVAVGCVLSTNERALALDKHLGFREVGRGRDWWKPGEDLIWLEMRKEECRWLRKVA